MRNAIPASILAGGFALILGLGCGGGGGPPPAVAPTLSGVSPSSGWDSGGERVVLGGTGFADGDTTVAFGGVPATGVLVQSPTSCSCRTPPAATGGPFDVTVTTGAGTATAEGAFTYYKLPPTFVSPDVRVDRSPGSSEDLDMCADGRYVYLVWQDDRSGLGDIYFNRSRDGGATWIEDDIRLDTDSPGAGFSEGPRVCCDGASVYVVWEDQRTGSPDIHLNRSIDGGATWLASDVRVNTVAAGHAWDAAVCCSGSNVYVAWADERIALSSDIYLNRSTDAGTTWLAEEVRLNTIAPGSAWSDDVQLCCRGIDVYAVWRDNRYGLGSIRFNRSSDAGATWLSDDVRLDTVLPDGQSVRPSIGRSQERLYVVWQDTTHGSIDILFDRSPDGGATWLASDVRLDTDAAGAADSQHPQLACDGDHVCVVWEDYRNGARDIYANGSSDGGSNWLSDDVRLDTDGLGAASSVDPRVCCSGANAYAVWQDERNGNTDVYFNGTFDGGATWLALDIRLDTDDMGAAGSKNPRVGCDGARVVVAWNDLRGSSADVYATRGRP